PQRLKGLGEHLADFLGEMGLNLNVDKTQITSFKKGFRFLGYVFSGDLLLPSQSQTSPKIPIQVNQNEPKLIYTEPIAQPTALQLAFLDSLRELRQPIPPPLYVVLGYTVRYPERVKIVSHEVIWRDGMSTLYVVQQGATVAKEQGRFVIKLPNGSSEEIPLKAIRQILVFGGVQLSTAAIDVCLQEKIAIFFLTQLGDYKGHLQCDEMTCLEAQTVQFRLRGESAAGLGLAQIFVRGKLANSRQLLLRLNRKRRLTAVEEGISALTAHLEQIEETQTLESLLGREGDSAARYFGSLGALIVNPGFTWRGRSRRPPLDPVNSLLSLGYTLLFNNVMSLLLAEGLNPYLGHLHHSQSKSPELALDLMEEFRSPVVDSLVLKLINQKTLKPTDFTFPDEEGGVYLTETAKRLFFRSFEERLNDLVSHPDLKESVSYRRVIHLQVIRYKRFLMESIPYESFLRPT
ncbi:MAG: CRISPR-associated endonuclease Cas1, partial [Cyanobacteriota bacterium]